MLVFEKNVIKEVDPQNLLQFIMNNLENYKKLFYECIFNYLGHHMSSTLLF